MALNQRDFEKQYADLIAKIQQQATPFPKNTASQIARKKRAKTDKFFFAVTYFPHYIEVDEEYRKCWKHPEKEYDWVKAGFAPFHKDLFAIADKLSVFNIIAGFRESAKDTLLGKIDVIHKLVFEDRWFVTVTARTEDKAETKVVPIKLELETNERLRMDFGELRGSIEWEFGSIITKTGRKVKGYGRDQPLRGEENFGHRPDYEIVNDINDPTKPDSPALVQKYVDSIKQDILKAVNAPRWGAIMLCNWTVKGDIVDEMLTGKNTSHFNKHIFRALVPNDLDNANDVKISRACKDAGFPEREKSAWEFRHPTLRLLKERKDDPEVFDAEMMMHPRNRRDQKFKDQYFRYHTKQDVASGNYVNYSFVDPSSKDAGDYKAIVTVGLGIRGGDIHVPIRRASIQQESIDWLLEESYRHKRSFTPKVFGVETNGFQILLKREYMRHMAKKKELLPFLEVQHTGESKESRIERLVPFVKEGIVTFDRDDPDQELLIRQLKAFPQAGEVSAGGLGDDGPDALAGCIELIEKYPHAGEVEYESLEKRDLVFAQGAY
jgi:predicted phage terminase large subunit-like protein